MNSTLYEESPGHTQPQIEVFNLLRISILVVASLLCGCANNYLKPEGVSQASLTSDNGILIGSFARNPRARAYYSQAFYFKNVTTNESHAIKAQHTFTIFNGKTRDNFKTRSSVGSVFVFSLPAGHYVFYNFRLSQDKGYVLEDWFSKQNYAIPFEIHPNLINYIGEIKLDQFTGKGLFGMKELKGGTWIISDQQARDKSVLKRIRPDLPLANIISIIPDRKEVFTPLVVLPAELRPSVTD